MCFSHKIKRQVPYEFTFTNAVGVLYHYPLHYMYMTLKNIFNLSNNTCRFHNENWGKISYYPVLPSTAISGSISQPRKTWFSHLGFPRRSLLCQPSSGASSQNHFRSCRDKASQICSERLLCEMTSEQYSFLDIWPSSDVPGTLPFRTAKSKC